MLAALGLGKKRSPSDEQLKKYRDAKEHNNKWQSNVHQLRTIANKLENAYSASKGDFAIGRYEELKAMIKTSIKEYESCLEQMQKKNAASHRSGGGGGRAGKTNSLMDAAANFASAQEKANELEESVSKAKRMTSEQVTHETAALRKESAALQREYQALRAKLERLAREYEDSKKYNPTQRYGVLKLLIKDTVKT